MSRELLVQMGRRTLAHAVNGTTPLADDLVEIPSTVYYDPARWALEMERVFKRVPLVLGFSTELREPGSYRALTVLGVPIVLTRGDDGVVRSFVNMCAHRGAILVDDGSGETRRFSCPYHGWNYDCRGALVGLPDRQLFGDLDRDRHGLTELACEERAGIIFGTITPGAALHLDEFLCGYDDVLANHRLGELRFVGRQELDGPNWKVAYDGYIDQYHLPVLHRDSFGADWCSRAVFDAWGPHQRMSAPDGRFLALDGVPEDDWTIHTLLSGVWTVFPHVSIAMFNLPAHVGGQRMYMISQLFPGADPDSSRTIQNIFATFDPSDEQLAALREQMKFLLAVVRDEDYFTGNRIQRAVKTGVKDHFVYGRNEMGNQRFHRWVGDLVATADERSYVDLLARAEVHHQP